jgi:hypothetical protein
MTCYFFIGVWFIYFVSMKTPIPAPTTNELLLQIANQARLSRLAQGFTQSELSRRSKVSYATIRKFENSEEIAFHLAP